MKKLISIFLLICIIFPFVGSVSWLNYQKKKVRKQIKHEIIAGIDKSELVQLSFTKAQAETELEWEHSKEFEYNNNMYDIIIADTTENIITYWCWWDVEETALNQKLKKTLANFLGKDTKNKETKTRFANFYQSLFHNKSTLWEAIQTETTQQLTTPYLFDYTSLQFPPTTPPPKYS